MKKTLFIVAAAMMFVACQKDEVAVKATKTLTLKATMEQASSASKTSFGEKVGTTQKLVWNAGDQILVVDEAGLTGTLTADALGDTATTTFTGEVDPAFGAIKYAFYGAFANYDAAEETIELTLPETCTNLDGISKGANPSYAIVSGDAAIFKNVCGILTFGVRVDYNVTTYSITSRDNNIAGKFSMDCTNGELTSIEGGKTMTVNCGGAMGTVQTYFIVPAGSFSTGFTVDAKSSTTWINPASKTNSANCTVNRSQIVKLPSITILVNDAGDELEIAD